MSEGSIHPRNWPSNGRDTKKSNTCKSPKQVKGKLAKKMRRLNQRQLDRESTLKQAHIKNPMAYKAPGSMNQHK